MIFHVSMVALSPGADLAMFRRSTNAQQLIFVKKIGLLKTYFLSVPTIS
jgi:hypothetical protein